MRIYMTLKHNLIDAHLMSIDRLAFESLSGDIVNVDFNQIDYDLRNKNTIHARLKDIGDTYRHEWDNLEGRSAGVDLVDDIEYFKGLELYEVGLHLDPSVNPVKGLEVKVQRVQILIKGEVINCPVESIGLLFNEGEW